MAVTMVVNAGNLPEGFCATSEQNRLNVYAQYLSVQFPANIQTFNYGATVPDPDNRIFPWFRTNLDGTPDKWYVYSSGYWISLHPTPASSPELRMYVGSLASIDTYDGGEVGAVTSITGPMWQVATTDGLAPTVPPIYTNWLMADKMFQGVGANFSAGATGGEINHLLTVDEMPSHSHAGQVGGGFNDGATGFFQNAAALNGINQTLYLNNTGGGNAHNNMPPYYAGYFIQRTARQYYRI